MKRKTFVLSILAAGLFTAPSFAARAGCCGSDTGAMPHCPAMSGHESHDAQPVAVASKLPQPVAAVFDNYIRIQTALAKDSLQGVAESARAIAKAVKDDTSKALSASVAQQADALAKGTDLPTTRTAFKPLSQSLIEYASRNPQVAGLYRQVHCSMADASWLQTNSVVNNPYLGKSMPHCGEFVKSAASAGQEHQGHSTHVH